MGVWCDDDGCAAHGSHERRPCPCPHAHDTPTRTRQCARAPYRGPPTRQGGTRIYKGMGSGSPRDDFSAPQAVTHGTRLAMIVAVWACVGTEASERGREEKRVHKTKGQRKGGRLDPHAARAQGSRSARPWLATNGRSHTPADPNKREEVCPSAKREEHFIAAQANAFPLVVCLS